MVLVIPIQLILQKVLCKYDFTVHFCFFFVVLVLLYVLKERVPLFKCEYWFRIKQKNVWFILFKILYWWIWFQKSRDMQYLESKYASLNPLNCFVSDFTSCFINWIWVAAGVYLLIIKFFIYQTNVALDLLRKDDVSAAIFAPGWVYETKQPPDFETAQNR